MRRGQAALEFLTTYGWAFLIILVMIGAIAYFGILDIKTSQSCISGQEFSCKGTIITDTYQGVKLRNNLQETIVITNVTIHKNNEELGSCLFDSTINPENNFDIYCTVNLTADEDEILKFNMYYHSETGTNTYSKKNIIEVKGRVISKQELITAGATIEPPINQGMKLYLEFDETTGTSLADSSGNNYVSTIIGTPQHSTSDCIQGNCLQMDGSTNVITLNVPTNNKAVSMWIKPSSSSLQVLHAGILGETYYSLVVTADNKLSIAGTDGATGKVITQNTVISTNSWQHVVIIRTDQAYPNEFKIYVNGNEKTLVPGGEHRVSQQKALGARYYSGAYQLYYSGKIDNFRVYNRELSESEIQALYTTRS